MRRYRAIFLDAGFTILDVHPSLTDLFLQVTRRLGMNYTLQDARRAEAASQAFFDAHYYRPNDTWTDDDAILAFWSAYYRLGLESLGCPRERLDTCTEALSLSLNHPDSWKLFPEVPGVLAGLRQAGYIVAILSDWTSSLPAILESLGVRPYVDFLVVSAIEKVAKPQPTFFQRALDRAQVLPGQALMVGDNLYADIEGAAQLGIRGLLLDRSGRQARANVPTIRRLDELWAFLH